MADLGEVRDRLAVALDMDDLVAALRMARRLKEHFGVAKVGLELFGAAGPEAVSALIDEGYKVFVDLKLHDIPNTVGRAARVLGALGASYATVHAAGGEDMVKAAVEGMTGGALEAGLVEPCVLGVTLLTSTAARPPERIVALAQVAARAGCGGVVLAASDLELLEQAEDSGALGSKDLVKVVPGIRLEGDLPHDQAATATPSAAFFAGASMIVVGRSVVGAADPEEAARKVALQVRDALESISGFLDDAASKRR